MAEGDALHPGGRSVEGPADPMVCGIVAFDRPHHRMGQYRMDKLVGLHLGPHHWSSALVGGGWLQ